MSKLLIISAIFGLFLSNTTYSAPICVEAIASSKLFKLLQNQQDQDLPNARLREEHLAAEHKDSASLDEDWAKLLKQPILGLSPVKNSRNQQEGLEEYLQIILTPDKKYAVSLSDIGTLRIYNAQTKTLLATEESDWAFTNKLFQEIVSVSDDEITVKEEVETATGEIIYETRALKIDQYVYSTQVDPSVANNTADATVSVTASPTPKDPFLNRLKSQGRAFINGLSELGPMLSYLVQRKNSIDPVTEHKNETDHGATFKRSHSEINSSSPEIRAWFDLIGKKLSDFLPSTGNDVQLKRTTFEDVEVTPNHEFAVTMSDDDILRVYRTSNSEFLWQSTPAESTEESTPETILALNNLYLVTRESLGVKLAGSRRQRVVVRRLKDVNTDNAFVTNLPVRFENVETAVLENDGHVLILTTKNATGELKIKHLHLNISRYSNLLRHRE